MDELDSALTVLTSVSVGEGFGYILNRAFPSKDITEKGCITLKALRLKAATLMDT